MLTCVPTVFIEGQFAFRFYSSDASERVHVHVVKDADEAKFWVDRVALVTNYGLSRADLQKVRAIILRRRQEIITCWERHFHENQNNDR